MTKLQNKIIPICIITCILLEITAAIGAYAAHFYTKTRMGMLRHMVYLNDKWEKSVPVMELKWAAILVLGILILAALVLYRKLGKRSGPVKLAMTWAAASGIGTVFYLLYFNTEMDRAYYLLSICFSVIALTQHLLFYCLYYHQKSPAQANG